MSLGSVSIWQIVALASIGLPILLWLTARRKGFSPWIALVGLLPLVNVFAVFGMLAAQARDTKKKIEFLVHVHCIPEWLKAHLHDPDSDSYVFAKDYERLTKDDVLWPIWKIDEYGAYWVEIIYLSDEGNARYHSVKLEEGTYAPVEAEPYDVICERPNADTDLGKIHG